MGDQVDRMYPDGIESLFPANGWIRFRENLALLVDKKHVVLEGPSGSGQGTISVKFRHVLEETFKYVIEMSTTGNPIRLSSIPAADDFERQALVHRLHKLGWVDRLEMVEQAWPKKNNGRVTRSPNQ